MQVNLINYEAGAGINGILTKFALKMDEELRKLGIKSRVATEPDPKADVNHHINFRLYREGGGGINTLMITHFLENEHDKLDTLKRGLKTAHMGIAMSEHTKARLIANGVSEEKLTYILPAHDGRKRRPFVVAILSKVYGDDRKREWMVSELAKVIDKEKFVFRIMGQGWDSIVNEMRSRGIEVSYFKNFDANLHVAILDSSDFLLYTGEDEGAISVLEAAQAGVKTIATPQGFHYEIGIDYPFSTQEELNAVFEKLQHNRVAEWTWEKYAREHLQLWQDLGAK